MLQNDQRAYQDSLQHNKHRCIRIECNRQELSLRGKEFQKIRLGSYLLIWWRRKDILSIRRIEDAFYINECFFDILKMGFIVCLFDIFIKFSLNLYNVWFESFSDKREINHGWKRPCYNGNNSRCSYKGSETTSDSSNEIWPKKPPWRLNILDKFLKSEWLNGINQMLKVFDIFWT